MDLPIFNWTYYYNALLMGYRYWLLTHNNDFTIVEPIWEPIERPGSYIVSFNDDEILDCSDGVDDVIIFYKDNVL